MKTKPIFTSLTSVVLLAILVGALRGPSVRVPTARAAPAAGTFYDPIVFVDKTSVDLHWDHPDPEYDTYLISRDGVVIATLGTSVTFYRDTGLTAGQTYTYQIDAIDQDTPPLPQLSSGPKTVTASEIGGTLYQDKTWPADTYDLANHIDIRPGVTFEIQSGSEITSHGGWKNISDFAGGELHLVGSTVYAANVIIGTAGSVVDNVTFQNDSILYYERSDDFTATNTFQDGATLKVGHHRNSTPTIRSQVFESGAVLWVKNDALPTIEQCTFEQAQIHIFTGGAIITQNVFRRGGGTEKNTPAILIESANRADILDNVFDDAGIEISPYASSSSAISIQNNEMAGGTQTMTGVRVRSGAPTITDNLIAGYTDSIAYSSDAGGIATGNTIIFNYDIRIIDTATPVLHDNCIAENAYGAYAPYVSQDIDMTGNWWGASSGPYNDLKNKDGEGNPVYGDTIDFSNWLTTSNCQAADLEITAMEAVQAIGGEVNWFTGVLEPSPTAAGRETIVRAYANARIGVMNGVEGELAAYRGGEYLGTINSKNTIRLEPKVDLETQRGDLENGAVYFELPAAWTTSGTLTYTVTLNPDNDPEELILQNNVLTGTVTFEEQPPFRIAYVPILYKPGGSQGVAPLLGPIIKGHVFLQSILPYADVEMGIFPTMTWEKKMKGTDRQEEWTNGSELLNILSVMLIQWNLAHPPEERFTQIIGVFPGSALEMISAGESDWRGDGASPAMGLGIASYCWASGDCFAHEIGHNLGLDHTNVEGKDCYAPDIESYWQQHYPDNTIQTFGYHDLRNELVPKTTPDIMSYCQHTWVSPLHWEMLLNAHAMPQPPYPDEVPVTASAPTAPQNAASAAETTYLLVRAWTTFEGVTEFLPFWRATSTDMPVWTPDNGTDYCIRMKDGAGNVMEEKCVDAHFADIEGRDPHDSWVITNHMVVALPLPSGSAAQNADGTLSEVAEISVFSDQFNQEVATLQPSAHPPVVEWIAPAPGSALTQDTVLRWSGSDADGDTLVYAVFYRPATDAPWMPLVVDTSKTSYLAALQDLPAGSAAQFKVTASDGYHVTEALSGAVSVPERSLDVYLLSPVAGEDYTPDVYLSGYGYHPDHGILPADALTWTSDRDGVLGTGDGLTVTLSAGEHYITLSGTYAGETVTTGINITVNPEATPITGLGILGPGEATTGEPVTLQASLASGTDVTYTWNFGDGSTATGKTATHIFPMGFKNTYYVTLTAVNSLSQVTTQKWVTINLNQVFLPVLVR